MRKIFKSAIIFVLMVIMSAVMFSACSRSSEEVGGATDNAPSAETPNNGIQHYEIELTKNNFDDFLEFNVTSVVVSVTTYEKDNFCEIKGVLNYAYYKNVTVSFLVEYANYGNVGDKNIYTGNFSVKLNAAGNCSFYTKDETVLNTVNSGTIQTLTNKSITITAVSGVIIFDI